MPTLESSIDGLYQETLERFVASRTALAKTLTGDDLRRVKRLQKPTAVPWAVNQVYWRERSVYDRVLESGGALRAAQIAALGGRSADVRGATNAHRTAIAHAVAEASRIAAAAGVNPNVDELAATFEALSLQITRTEPAGRLSKSLQPAGFEALAGVVVKPSTRVQAERLSIPKSDRPIGRATSLRPVEDIRARQRAEAAAERRRREAVAKAEAVVARAQQAEARARAEWERRKRDLEVAEQALAQLETR